MVGDSCLGTSIVEVDADVVVGRKEVKGLASKSRDSQTRLVFGEVCQPANNSEDMFILLEHAATLAAAVRFAPRRRSRYSSSPVLRTASDLILSYIYYCDRYRRSYILLLEQVSIQTV